MRTALVLLMVFLLGANGFAYAAPAFDCGMGMSAALQEVAFWEMSLSEPGDYFDFQPTDMNRVLVVLSGQVDLSVSNGDAVSLSRGDLLFQTDVMGQGHRAKIVGLEPCLMVSMAMPGGLK